MNSHSMGYSGGEQGERWEDQLGGHCNNPGERGFTEYLL